MSTSPIPAWIDALRNPPSRLRPELWRRHLTTHGPAVPALAAAPGGERLYVAARSGHVFALNAASGEAIWPAPAALPTEIGDGLTVAQGCLWLPGLDGHLYALEAETGRVLHRLEIGGRLSSPPLAVGDRLYQSVDVAAERLGAEGQVVMVDAAAGRVLQRWQASSRAIRAQPTLLGQTLFVGDRQSNVALIDLRSDQLHSVSLPGGRILGPGAADAQRGQVIFGTLYGLVAALDANGAVRWQSRLSSPPGCAVVGRPCLHGDRLFVAASDGRVYALNPATGESAQPPFVAGDPIAAELLAWREWLFVASRNGSLYALYAANLKTFWVYPSGNPISSAPALTADGRLFVVDEGGHLNSLRWCLAHYAEAARHAQESTPPRWEEACELWMLAHAPDAALEAAEKAGRLDLIAALAAQLRWHKRAAQAHSELARRQRQPQARADHWRAAAALWALEGDAVESLRCRLQAAEAVDAPLLELVCANLPALLQGQAALLQVSIRNLRPALARQVTLHFSGHVAQAGRLEVGTVGPSDSVVRPLAVTPSLLGTAQVHLQLEYADAQGQAQAREELIVSLAVAQPPKVEHHYHGPTVIGEGFIIQRSSGRRLAVGAEDAEIERGERAVCPHCGWGLKEENRYCDRCGRVLE